MFFSTTLILVLFFFWNSRSQNVLTLIEKMRERPTSDKFEWRPWPLKSLDCFVLLRCDLKVHATRFDDDDDESVDGWNFLHLCWKIRRWFERQRQLMLLLSFGCCCCLRLSTHRIHPNDFRRCCRSSSCLWHRSGWPFRLDRFCSSVPAAGDKESTHLPNHHHLFGWCNLDTPTRNGSFSFHYNRWWSVWRVCVFAL